jgi:hypothetical protein
MPSACNEMSLVLPALRSLWRSGDPACFGRILASRRATRIEASFVQPAARVCATCCTGHDCARPLGQLKPDNQRVDARARRWHVLCCMPRMWLNSKICVVAGSVVIALAGVGCADVSAHDLRVSFTLDGVTSTGVVTIPDYDRDDQKVSGDSSCGLFTGNCGTTRQQAGRAVDGNLPLRYVGMESIDDSTTYDFEFTSPQVPQPAGVRRADGLPIGVRCRAYFRDGRSVEASCWGRASASIVVSTL